mgnify:CR=1 FL=1
MTFKMTDLEKSIVSTFFNADGEYIEQVASDIVSKMGFPPYATRSVSAVIGSLTRKGVLNHKEEKKGLKIHFLSEAYLETIQ